MQKKPFTLPFILPVAGFAFVILAGAFLLSLDKSAAGDPVSFVDALFISTSSVCVTGLASVDPAQVFNRFGHVVMIVLIQLGGLGITTYTTLIFYVWSKRISLTDRLAVGQALLNDSSFHLGRFLQRVVTMILLLEGCGALVLYLAEPERIGAFHAIFLAISAFCNAGFALWPDNLIRWEQHTVVNLVIMLLIIFGGIGFAVLDECSWRIKNFIILKLHPNPTPKWRVGYTATYRPKRFSRHSQIVLTTTAVLIVGGAFLIYIPELFSKGAHVENAVNLILPSLFQSVTSRTAGFCTVDIGHLTDVSLLLIIMLMFIGGSPGSCAGGIKTTTFRVLISFIVAQLKGRSQVVVQGKAMDTATINKMFVLLTFSGLTVSVATFMFVFLEGGNQPHGQAPFQVVDLLFESVSAFATVGLSTGVTPHLSTAGKLLDCLLMFMGRLGPIWLITTLQQFQVEPKYRLPESELPIG